MGAVAVSKDEEVGDLVVLVPDVAERWGAAGGGAELDPGGEGPVAGGVGLGNIGFGCELQRSAEVSREFISGSSRSSRQGASCG